MHRLLAACALLAATAAHAQTFELERLQLDPAARGSLVVGSGEVAPRGTLRLAGAVAGQGRPLVRVGARDLLGRRSDDAATAIVRDRLSLHVVLDCVVLDRLELYARGSYVLAQTTPGAASGVRGSGPGAPSFGMRFGLLEQIAGAPLSAAIAAEILPPWGTNRAFAKFDEPAGVARAELGRRMRRAVIAAQGGVLVTHRQERIGERELGSEAQGGVVVALAGRVRPELSARGAFGIVGDRGPASLEVLGGLRLALGRAEPFVLGGPGFFDRPGTPQWRALGGVALALEPEPSSARSSARTARAPGSPRPRRSSRRRSPAYAANRGWRAPASCARTARGPRRSRRRPLRARRRARAPADPRGAA
jgi:hypothetical protein